MRYYCKSSSQRACNISSTALMSFDDSRVTLGRRLPLKKTHHKGLPDKEKYQKNFNREE
jgi:hypothetical protein